MNHKQKFGYMALGAAVLALGVIIGQWVTPDIEAQNNGVFDKVVCRELEVINEEGSKRAIHLGSDNVGSFLSLKDEDGEAAITLSVDGLGKGITIYAKGYKEAITINHLEHFKANSISLYNTPTKKKGIDLLSSEWGSSIKISDAAGNVSWQAR